MKVDPGRHVRELAAAALLAVVAVVGGTASAPAAFAHNTNGKPTPDAAHFLTQITALRPASPGLSAAVDPRGEWIEISNTTSQTLTVLGYAREPYLRIAPAGVSENTLSPTLALNDSLFGDISQFEDTTVPPDWRQTSPAHTARWHDHRIHWMGATRPPAVKAHPEVGQLVGNWTVRMTLADEPVTITGTLSWLPLKKGASPLVNWVLIADSVVFAGVVAGLLVYARRRRVARRATVGDDLDVTSLLQGRSGERNEQSAGSLR